MQDGVKGKNNFFEEQKIEFLRKGLVDRVSFLENLHLKILPGQAERIQQNDKTVLKELVLPSWLSWDMLFSWANSVKFTDNKKRCIFCNNMDAVFIDFREKFLCQNCFLKLKEI